MGFGLPAAIGAIFACPEREVGGDLRRRWFPDDPGRALHRGPEKHQGVVAIINNGYLGMVRSGRSFFKRSPLLRTPMRSPDFVKIADAQGLVGLRVTERSQVEEAVRAAQQAEGTVVVVFRVEQEDSVYPMVPTGASLEKLDPQSLSRLRSWNGRQEF